MSAPANPFIKNLAANDRPTRDAALSSLESYLSSRKSLSTQENLQIWRGLFYSMWHSDRPRPQQALASSLASLISVLPDVASALRFQKAFWTTMAQQWDRIDVLRMDKFLLLVRRFVGAGMKWAVKESAVEEWANKCIQEDALAPLNVTEKKVPTGLRMHVLDVWVDEMEKLELGDEEKDKQVREQLLKPVEVMAKDGFQKVWRNRAKETLADDRVKAWRGEPVGEEKESAENGDEEEWGGCED